jgi:hypothetical protein
VPSEPNWTHPPLYQLKKKVLSVLSYTLCHEDIGGSGGIAPPFLTSVLDGVVSAYHSITRRTRKEYRGKEGKLICESLCKE